METIETAPNETPVTQEMKPEVAVSKTPETKTAVATASLVTRTVSWFTKQTSSVKLLVGSVGFFLFLLFLLVATSLRNQSTTVVTPSPEASAQPIESALPRSQSAYSQTAPFQQFEQNLKNLQSFNATVNLAEIELAFPLLDTDVNFGNN
ncbi:TPA: hypothetical protein DIV55_02895 [Patescibacteria group bacterium]|nr:hypothetical protein [Patescibacteria group bacterium]